MEILFYEYGSICEPDILIQFQKLGLTVTEEKTEISNKNLLPSERITILSALFDTHSFLFVFSINFFPSISDICEIYHIPYICWSVDSPVLELFSKSICNKCNQIFLFDKKQYEDLLATMQILCKDFSDSHSQTVSCSRHIHHLPLATNVSRLDDVLATLSPHDMQKYAADVSFVGSLYTEKDPYLKLSSLSAHTKGFSDGLIQAQNNIIGTNILEHSLIDEIVADIRSNAEKYFYFSDACTQSLSPHVKTLLQKRIDTYITAHQILGMHASSINRIDLLNALSEEFSITLYTRSDTAGLNNINSSACGIRLCGGVKTLTEMPKVFHLSKINLNMTIFPIQTGLPLRIWDVLGCGGFLLTNYQEELTDYFTPGVDLDYYTCKEELLEKCRFYLQNDAIRANIAANGYHKVKKHHTYEQRIAEIIKQALSM